MTDLQTLILSCQSESTPVVQLYEYQLIYIKINTHLKDSTWNENHSLCHLADSRSVWSRRTRLFCLSAVAPHMGLTHRGEVSSHSPVHYLLKLFWRDKTKVLNTVGSTIYCAYPQINTLDVYSVSVILWGRWLPLLLRPLNKVTHGKGKRLKTEQVWRSFVFWWDLSFVLYLHITHFPSTNLWTKHILTPRNAKLPWTAAAHSKFKCCVMSPPTVGP